MNKNELVAKVAEQSKSPKADVARTVDSVFDVITQTLQNQEDVRLTGFGTFTTLKRASSEGRNPRTGDVIQIPASVAPKFKPMKALKDAVSSGQDQSVCVKA